MGRRPRSIRDMRLEHEAAVARGLVPEQEAPSRGSRQPSLGRESKPDRSAGPPRLRVVWQVRDIGGRTVATYAYSEKEVAETHAARLKSQGKGNHFVTSEKVPMT